MSEKKNDIVGMTEEEVARKAVEEEVGMTEQGAVESPEVSAPAEEETEQEKNAIIPSALEDVDAEDDGEAEDDSAAADDGEEEAMLLNLKHMAATAATERHKGGRNGAPAPRPGVFRSKRPGQGHTIDRDSHYEDPERAEKRAAQIKIYQSFLKKTVLTGNIIGVQRAKDRGADGKLNYFIKTMLGPYQVYIPFDKFTDTNLEELLTRMQSLDPSKTMDDFVQMYLENRLNAEIDFVITNIETDDTDGNDLSVAGDRVEAMYRQRVYHWFGTERTTGEYKLNVGSKVEARIIYVCRSGIRVEIFGVESFIQSKDLAYTFIQDARTQFEVGKRVWVRLTDVKRDVENDYAVEFTASVRDALPDLRERGVSVFLPGGIYVGTVNYIRLPTKNQPNARPSVFVKMNMEGVQVCCPFPIGQVHLEVGAKCFIRVTNVNRERKQLYGFITHVEAPKTNA